MNPLTTIIIEDEKPSARKLQKLLSNFPEIEIVAVLESVQESVDYFKNNPHPSIIFSDIVLGDGLSFDVFEQCKPQSFIIFTTAFDDYTLKAFKLNSIDYLLKPIDEDELAIAINKFKKMQETLPSNSLPDYKRMMKEEKPKLNRILVKIGYQMKIINIQEICCFYSNNKMVYAQTQERAYPTDFSLEELETVLPEAQFFRTNRQVIIQLSFIKNIITSPLYKVELSRQPEVEITVSRERVKDFKNWLVG